jgi:hypothetical protein
VLPPDPRPGAPGGYSNSQRRRRAFSLVLARLLSSQPELTHYSVVCPFESSKGYHPVSLGDEIRIDCVQIRKCRTQVTEGRFEAGAIRCRAGQRTVANEVGRDQLAIFPD